MYITKYAATKGIFVANVDADGVDAEHGKVYVIGKGCFENMVDAKRDAIRRVRRKITALVAKEAKLESMIDIWEMP